MANKLILVLATLAACLGLAQPSWSAPVPEAAQRHFDRGMAAVEMAKTPEDYETAIREFKQAQALAPDWPEVYYNLGLIQDTSGNYRDAVDSLRRYLQLAPDSPDAVAIRTLINKAEFKAEQVLTDEDILDIVVSLNDRSQWQLKGITNPKLLKNGFGWVNSFERDLSPEHRNRLLFSFRSNTGCPQDNGICPGSALPNGNIVEFQTFVCAGTHGNLVQWFNYRLEVISRNKIKMFVKVQRSKEYAEQEDEASYEFVRR